MPSPVCTVRAFPCSTPTPPSPPGPPAPPAPPPSPPVGEPVQLVHSASGRCLESRQPAGNIEAGACEPAVSGSGVHQRFQFHADGSITDGFGRCPSTAALRSCIATALPLRHSAASPLPFLRHSAALALPSALALPFSWPSTAFSLAFSYIFTAFHWPSAAFSR